MRRLTTFILNVFILGQITAQTTNTFRVNYNVGLMDLPGGAIEAHAPGNYVFAGTNLNFLPIVGTITELNNSGTVAWSKSYSGGFSFQISDIKKDPAGGYYACGGSSSASAFMLKVDNTGNYIDANKFDLANSTGDFLNKIIKTSDGGYVAAGYASGYDPDGGGPLPKNDSTSALVVKFDANGNRLWHHVFRFYKESAKINAIRNDASFVDVIEVSDGYIFVGRYEVDDVINTNSDGDDMTPDDAMILKTTPGGTITYFKQLDNPSTSGTQKSKTFNSISKTAAGLALISGYDGDTRPLMLYRMNGAGGWTVPTWSQKYGVSGFLGYNVMEPSAFFETSDGNYAVMGMYINPLAFDFSQYLMKVNPTDYSSIFTKKYTFNLAVILPVGQEVSDGGFLSLSTTMAGTGFDYHILKTDPMGVTGPACPEGILAPTKAAVTNVWADPFYNSFTTDVVDNTDFTPVIATISPTSTVQCLTIIAPCSPPPATATTVTAVPSALCAGQSAVISASGSGAGVTYRVFAAATGGTSLGNVPYTVSPTTTTTYYVETVSNSDPSCVSATRVAVTITVNTAPTATAGSNSPVCAGGDLNLTANTVTGATYSWTGPGGFTSTSQNPTLTAVTASMAGTYTVIISNGGCDSPGATVQVVVGAMPPYTITKTDPLCSGGNTGTATVNIVTNPSSYTYSWSPTGGSGATASSLPAGTYTVTISGAGGCNATQSVVLTDPAPMTVTVATTQTSCTSPTGTATATAVSGSAITAYSWSPSGGTGATASGLSAGNYTVTVTNANGCTATALANINAINGPVLTVASVTDVTCIAPNSGAATVSVTGGTPGYTYNWIPSGGTGATASNLSAGIYTATVTDNAGCTAAQTITIGSGSQMNVQVNGSNATCGNANGTVTAVASGGSGTYTYTWSPGNLSGSNQSSLPAGTYIVTVSDGSGCTATATYNVGVNGNLNVVIMPPSATIDEGDTVILNTTHLPNIPGATYVWTPAVGLSCTDCPNPLAYPSETTTYTVTVTTPDGCTGKAEITIFVNKICGEYYIPTIFSPNSDGSNDEFCILGECITSMHLKIYDRWGELVFQSTLQNDCWDGTYKGKLMNSATFVYVVDLVFIDGKVINQKGNLSLLR